MAIIAFIFGIMSYFYRYVTPEELGEVDNCKEEERDRLGGNATPLEYLLADSEKTKV